MVKLYYTPTSCGASSFICAFIAKLNFDCEVVDLSTHKTESGIDFYTINPKGNVPAIILDDGTLLNENIVCLEYIADNSVNKTLLAPKYYTNERYILTQLLSYVSSELHSTIGLLFNPASKDEYIRQFIISIFEKKMKYLQENILSPDRIFAFGDSFTILDAYLHIVLSWTQYVKIDLEKYPVAYQYYKNICNFPEVMRAKNRIATTPKFTFN